MSFRSVMVDQCRPIVYTRGARDATGESTTVSTYGKWFRCRLVPAGSQASRSGSSARRDVEQTTLIYHAKDGTLSVNDRVEVKSRELGTDIYVITGDPQPIRKRRYLLGYQATIRRADAI